MLRDADPSAVAIEGFAIEAIGPDVILATWDTVGPRPVRRSSIWVREQGRWPVRIHQGTLL